MKTLRILLKIIMAAGLVLSCNQALPQGRIAFSAGYGWPEMANFGIRYGNKFQAGICQSFSVESLNSDNNQILYMWATAVEVYYHFGGKPKHTDLPPWYAFGALGFLWGQESDNTDEYFYPRVGRAINFTKRLGINIDAGIFFPLSKGARDFFDYPVYPSGSVSFFIRL